jgi:Carboxypeptidase regulatory-like domain
MTSVRLLCLACSLLLSGTLLAQTAASISGTVTDPSGAAVADANVTATNLGTGAVRSAKSNATGFYWRLQLLTYRLSACPMSAALTRS